MGSQIDPACILHIQGILSLAGIENQRAQDGDQGV